MNKIEDIHVQLANHGFLIYKKGESWVMRKIPVPGDDRILEEVPFLTYEGALQEATKLKDPPAKAAKWSVTIRYNRGLGIEYRTLDNIEAANHKDAQTLAEELALGFCVSTPGMERAKLLEVRVRPG